MNFSDLLSILSAAYMWFISALPILTIIATFIVAIVTYYSFAYERKPIINIESKLTDYEFTIKNLGKNPAKNITIEIKLFNNDKSDHIGKYKLNDLNPESENVINLSEKINSKLEKIGLLIKTDYKWPKDPEHIFIDEYANYWAILNDDCKENELETLHSYKINNNFKIFIKFEAICKTDVPLLSPTHRFFHNFEVSYEMQDLDFIGEEDPQTDFLIAYGRKPNFNLFIKPSMGEWI